MKILEDTRGADDVAVVGAGVIGLSIAFHLAGRGLGRVAVYEREGIAAAASGVQPGGVRQQWATEVNCLMARESLGFYREIGDRLDVPPLRFDDCGYLFLAHSETRLDELTAAVDVQNQLGIGSTILTPSQVVGLVPGLDPSEVLGASYLSEDGYFDEPQAVVEAFATACRRLGTTIRQSEVVALEQVSSGWLLQHSDGSTSHAGTVVVATGYDAPDLVAPLGIELPIKKEPRYLFLSEPISERLLDPLVVSAELGFAAKQLANGRVLASDLSAGTEPSFDATSWRRNVKAATSRLLPILEYVSYPILVEGFYDVTPDHQAIVGSVDGFENLWLAAGFSGHGFMMAPAVGRSVSAGIAGEADDELAAPWALSRFSRSGGLVPEAQIV